MSMTNVMSGPIRMEDHKTYLQYSITAIDWTEPDWTRTGGAHKSAVATPGWRSKFQQYNGPGIEDII